MAICIVSGYFNPIHPGHVSLIRDVKSQWPDCTLFAIVNNDYQVKLKNSVPLLDEKTRRIIVQNIKGVDEAYIAIDKSPSVVETLNKIMMAAPDGSSIFFCNGGDRSPSASSVPEVEFCDNNNISLKYGLGDNKVYASSKLLEGAAKWINHRDFWRNFTDEILAEFNINVPKS